MVFETVQAETSQVPYLVAKMMVIYDAMNVQVDFLNVLRVINKSESQGVGSARRYPIRKMFHERLNASETTIVLFDIFANLPFFFSWIHDSISYIFFHFVQSYAISYVNWVDYVS